MRNIRFIRIGPSNHVLIRNLVWNLNYLQNQFLFLFDDDIVAYPEDLDLAKPVSTIRLNSIIREYMIKKSYDEYPVAICDCDFENELFIEYDEKKALFTTSKWTEHIHPYSILRGVTYQLADVLLSLYIKRPVHSSTRGCPTDFCGNLEDIRIGLSKCEYCSECRSEIFRAIAQEEITLQQVVAIYKILDFVANRRICFVCMPFAKDFDVIYQNAIKPSLTSHNWDCRRSDEIYETREIMTLIMEQILRSDLIIADLTGRNPNVFYELGYAHAQYKNTILLTQSINDVPFDLRRRQLIPYNNTSEGLKRLSESIARYL